jgi:hypothetical protein
VRREELWAGRISCWKRPLRRPARGRAQASRDTPRRGETGDPQFEKSLL